MSKLKVEIVIEFDTEEELRLAMDQIFEASERSAKAAKNAAKAGGVRFAARKQRTADLLDAIGNALDTATIKTGSGGPIVIPGEEIKIGDTLLGWAISRVVDPDWNKLKPSLVTDIADGQAIVEHGDQFKLTGYLYRVAPRTSKES